MELTPRKLRILTIMLEEYIRTGEPVGSKAVAEGMGHAVSSATVRGEMAELAAMGLVQQPHTSAGRIPTAPAFRLYIDRLMSRDRLPDASRRHIDAALAENAHDPERLLEEAARLLAAATGCAAVTAAPADDHRRLTVRGAELMPLPGEGRGCLAALVLAAEGGQVRTRVCRLPTPPSPEALALLERVLAGEVVGQPMRALTLPHMQGLLAALGEHALTLAPVLAGIHELAQAFLEADFRLTGQMNLLRHPDFELERVRALMDFLSARERVSAMLEAHTGGLKVVFGSEAPQPGLQGASIILTRYVLRQTPDHPGGAVGVIGPVRMDYAQAIPQIEHIAATLGRLLNELLE